mmetsp:Transcript_113173/g.300693  ORF Transcript_113173/g.300693 Transcript_113173/m.300693 type:complete len:80 (-) Transcript_113173:273-512(-)
MCAAWLGKFEGTSPCPHTLDMQLAGACPAGVACIGGSIRGDPDSGVFDIGLSLSGADMADDVAWFDNSDPFVDASPSLM